MNQKYRILDLNKVHIGYMMITAVGVKFDEEAEEWVSFEHRSAINHDVKNGNSFENHFKDHYIFEEMN